MPADSNPKAGIDLSENVILTIRVEQKNLGEEFVSETITSARLAEKNNKIFLTYHETDGEGGTIRSLIRAGNDQVEIIRHGAEESRMILAAGKRTVEMRMTPAGPMRIEAVTKEYNMLCRADTVRIDVLYDLFLDGDFISLCRAQITAVPDKTAYGR